MWVITNEIEYDKRGNITICANLSVIAVGMGVIVSDQFPNLSGQWECYVQSRPFGELYATENEFRHLKEPLDFLGCQAEDRVKFIFNAWERTVAIEKVQD